MRAFLKLGYNKGRGAAPPYHHERNHQGRTTLRAARSYGSYVCFSVSCKSVSAFLFFPLGSHAPRRYTVFQSARDQVKACLLPEGGTMPYPHNVPAGYAEEEITAVIAESIASHLEFAQRRLSAYELHCSDFEQRHGMSTEAFLECLEAGTLGDQQEWFDWYAAAQGKKIWSRKRDILARLR